MRKGLVLTLTGVAIAATAMATPAAAACGGGSDICTDTTTVTFGVVDGFIAIVATEAAVGVSDTTLAPQSGTVGGSNQVTVPLGVTTVTDTRLSSSGWNASASAGVFSLIADATKQIPASSAQFAVPNAPVAVSGFSTPTFSNRASTPTGTGGSATLFTASATGLNAAVYTPVMTVTIPANTPTGLYTGTVTQSVS